MNWDEILANQIVESNEKTITFNDLVEEGYQDPALQTDLI
jgi:hypothetical protein